MQFRAKALTRRDVQRWTKCNTTARARASEKQTLINNNKSTLRHAHAHTQKQFYADEE